MHAILASAHRRRTDVTGTGRAASMAGKEKRREKRSALPLGRLLSALRPEFLAYAMSLEPEPAAAEDLVQEAILRALGSSSAPREAADLRPWMFRIIRNLFLDGCRRTRVRQEFSSHVVRLLDTGGRGGAPSTEDPVEALIVRQALERLAGHEREILCLVDVLGLTYREAAAVLEVPQGTVMSRLSRARRAMIRELGESNVRPLGGRNRGRGTGDARKE